VGRVRVPMPVHVPVRGCGSRGGSWHDQPCERTVSSRRTLARCVALSFADTVVATFLDALLYDSSMLVMEGILTIVMVVS